MDNLEYVRSKLKSGLFNINVVIQQSNVSRFLINKIVRNEPPFKPYVIDALADYFRKVSE